MFATEEGQSSEELGSLNKKYSEILEEKKVANSLIIGRKKLPLIIIIIHNIV